MYFITYGENASEGRHYKMIGTIKVDYDQIGILKYITRTLIFIITNWANCSSGDTSIGKIIDISSPSQRLK